MGWLIAYAALFLAVTGIGDGVYRMVVNAGNPADVSVRFIFGGILGLIGTMILREKIRQRREEHERREIHAVVRRLDEKTW